MSNEIKEVVKKFKEVKNILKSFSDKDKAIEYLINETKLSKEECSMAYELLLKLKIK